MSILSTEESYSFSGEAEEIGEFESIVEDALELDNYDEIPIKIGDEEIYLKSKGVLN